MVAIIDYDAGNLKSVENALLHLGESTEITREPQKILGADRVILPGVGAFGDAMAKLKKYGLDTVIQEVHHRQIPFLGICLGLQLLFEQSDEAPGIQGLGLLSGKISAIPEKSGYKIPHMGWNSIQIRENARLFQGISQDAYVYFVHSYYLQAAEDADVAAKTEYIVDIHASVEHGNTFACQFHPEKSGDIGLKILQNFCRI